MLWGALAVGGILGSLTRYWLSLLQPSAGWPWATFWINLSGAYVLALFLTLAFEWWSLPAPVRLGIGTGFVGSYTTFSTLVLETWHLIAQGHPWEALLYLHLSVLGGLVLAFAGHQTAMDWMRRRVRI